MIAPAGPCKTGSMSSPLRCLVTGASGYIGGRLVPELLSAGYAVRCMARDPGKLSDRPWSDDVEIAVADVMDQSAVRRALEGVDVAYYLIHSLGTDASFERRDRTAAQTFAAAAKAAGVQRIVYLGGIISGQAGKLSPHLRSRAEVGDILLASGVPTAALQAAVIIGSGSASFEMLRYLTERLPGDDAAEVDDALHAGGEGLCRRAVTLFERRVRAEGVDQVVGDVHALQGAPHRAAVHHVGDRDLDVVRPRAVAELPRIARHAPHRVSRAQQFRDEPAADVPRRAGNQAVQWR